MVLDEQYVARHLGAQPGEYVLLSVSDTGVGMSRAVQARIFEPFFTTKTGKGSGLGLAAVYGIVKQNGGNIWVYSEEGQGSTFKIYLPRTYEAVTTRQERPEQEAALPRGNETILLVEDNADVREIALLTLRRLGYRVLAAANGREALRLAREHVGAIHLLLTDVVMPGMNGRELANRVLAMRPNVKVIMMSGYSGDILAGGDHVTAWGAWLQKPISVFELARTVRQVLDAGVALLEKPFSAAALAQRVRAVLDR